MGPRILVVNQNWIGDVLFSTPAIRAIRKQFPGSFLASLVPPRCKTLLIHNPYLNEVMVHEDAHSFGGAFLAANLIGKLKAGHFDTAIFFHPSRTKVFLSKAAGISERIGYLGLSGERRFLTRGVPLPDKSLHKTDLFLNLLKEIGVASDGRAPDYFPGEEDERDFVSLCRDVGAEKGEPYVVVHPGGNWALKRWPADFFAEWIRLFLKEYPSRVFLCGTSSEIHLSEQIVSSVGSGRVISLCGKTSLGALALLLKKSRLFLSNDSGPIHLAASQGTKIIGLFGPTSPELTGPLSDGACAIIRKNVGCEVPCYFRSCHYRVCMEWLTPEEVFEKAKELLA